MEIRNIQREGMNHLQTIVSDRTVYIYKFGISAVSKTDDILDNANRRFTTAVRTVILHTLLFPLNPLSSANIYIYICDSISDVKDLYIGHCTEAFLTMNTFTNTYVIGRDVTISY